MDPINSSLVHYFFSAPDNVKFREEIKAVQNQQYLCLRELETPTYLSSVKIFQAIVVLTKTFLKSKKNNNPVLF